MNEIDRLEYDAVTRQLERMRAMQYAYHRKFFTLLLISTLVAGVCLMVPSVSSLIFLCFGIVTTGVTAAFFLHFCNFARIHARALESRINQLLGTRALIASQLEAEYFYPSPSPILVMANPGELRFFGFYTLHFCGVWVLLLALASWQLRQRLQEDSFVVLALIWTLWTVFNGVFVHRWFQGAAERRLAEQLEQNLGVPLKG